MKYLCLVLLLATVGCMSSIISALSPEAQLEVAKRQVSIRAVGMLGVEPYSGTVFCVLCYITYSRNMPPIPDPVPLQGPRAIFP